MDNTTIEVWQTEGYDEKTALQSYYTPMLVCLSQITNCSFLFVNALYSKRWAIKCPLQQEVSY